jgi:hypothetical protein
MLKTLSISLVCLFTGVRVILTVTKVKVGRIALEMLLQQLPYSVGLLHGEIAGDHYSFNERAALMPNFRCGARVKNELEAQLQCDPV